MRKKERSLMSGIFSLVIIAIIIMALGSIPTIVGDNNEPELLIFEWRSDTGSDVVSVDISNGHPNYDVYVVAGSRQNLTVYNGTGSLQWYDNHRRIADHSGYGTSHSVAISGNAQYIVAGDVYGWVWAYNIAGSQLWADAMANSSGDACSVDVSNPDRNENNEAYVVSCSGDWFYVFNA